MRYLFLAARDNLIGQIQSINISLNWDHSSIKDSPFERIHNLIIYDFSIHWIDFISQIFDEQKAISISAAVPRTEDQGIAPPLLAGVLIGFNNGMATLYLTGSSQTGARESISIVGSEGTLLASGNPLACSEIEIQSRKGQSKISLDGSWYPDGFRGTMGELLCSIEENREPSNSAKNNLRTLELVFAIINSADTNRVCVQGCVSKIGDSCTIAD